ncbi:hypothetical protein IDH50_06830 [Aeromicrobium tamlense]|uniref:Uncharacterized protein n=1 Tax=Aeromicrobium tamlense TaxID=375541 RepID=A0A8I0FXX2_9ACTN|nr:hypothetical protein [Aeromicrobium tamlense]MBD1269937.1 hypothetical protein [Aeromicrobium tamlense]NYI39406.1 hypothetical protein [Aeromicrobium tamlense]
MDTSDDYKAAIKRAVLPNPTDLVMARTLLLKLAVGGPIIQADFLKAWLLDHDLDGDATPGLVVAERGALLTAEHVDRGEPALVRQRGALAFRVAATELLQEGRLQEVSGNLYGTSEQISISLEGPSFNSSVTVDVTIPVIPNDRRVGLPYARTEQPRLDLLNAQDYVAGLGELLGDRALRTLLEAHEALRRRLWISAVSLLSVASEAAWFSLGRALARDTGQLRKALENDSAADVIRLVSDELRSGKRAHRATVDQLTSRAHSLRAARNYALHTKDEPDALLETYFTELGCIAEFAASRPYFVELASLLRKLD